MVKWQRLIFPFLRHIHKRVVDHHHANPSAPSLAISRLASSLSQGQIGRITMPTLPCFSRPIFLGFQHQGISTTAPLLANSSEEAPVLSPLVPVSSLGGSKGEDQKQKAVTKPETVQAILKGIKQVIHSARANASHNHGLDPERLIVAEAFVGKGYFKKRIAFHAKGKSGLIMRPECRLTVVVREITPKEEADIARLRVHNFKKLTKRERRLVPHQLIETTPVWGRKNKSSGQNLSAAPA
ncbi:50S ribosomal protein L22, chloroplastic isoform X2 [Vigna angularis]|uniref:50S ribosomal protein L22, chloroplastic isoform X2 n=1 Tax=Phaseolus angularis TaxID=3914 RepID=UPI0022B432FD|nr:50S ribosomal protein L22, chloroplastic isoform X2 [Vigna angularis]